MTFLRSLGVVATVGAAVVGVACGDEDGASGLTVVSQSGSQGASVSEGSSDSDGGVSSSSGGGATTESPTSSTGEPGTSTGSPTTGSGTTAEETTMAPGTTTGEPAGCGNGVIEGNEQCDGANLNGFTCEALGNAGGTLLCDPMTCTFDTQMCMVGDSGGDTDG